MTITELDQIDDQTALAVWIVEDNAMLRESYAAVLTDAAGIESLRAFVTCEDAVSALRAGAVPDVVLLDIGLPGMDGIEGARVMHALSPTTRIVMLTVHEDRDRVFRALCAGATGYVVKPHSALAVVEAIHEIRRGGLPMSPSIARKVLEIFQRWGAPTREYGLTEREKGVLQLLVDGESQKRIATKLELSEHTVNTHIRNVYAKLHVHSRTAAVAKALTEHLI